MTWRATDPQGDEAGKIRHLIVPFTRGRGLDLGCGPSKAWPHFIGVDNYTDTALFGTRMTPDVVADCDTLDLFADESMDFVFSSHLLEHIQDHEAALRAWWRVIKPGGYLVLYLPDRDLYPRMGTEGSNPDHKHDFCREDILCAVTKVAEGTDHGVEILFNEQRAEGREYSFFQVFRKGAPGVKDLTEHYTPRVQPSVCVVRYGGCGDMMQTAAVLPALKRAGFHVTIMCTPRAANVLKGNPHVDLVLVQDHDQVPNPMLSEYWDAWRQRYTRFVNLSESVEGTLLAMPGRASHAWPIATRRRMMGTVNYNEFMAELAGVKFSAVSPLFYPTNEEREAAETMLEPNRFNIVMALAGSSVHKVWPHMDSFIARCLLKIPDAVIHLVGDAFCKILEQGWENEARVHRWSGEVPERLALALAQLAQFVVGPETGIPNAVAFDRVPKAVMLSHSSARNLTHHWVNCTAIEPNKAVTCYPCHMIHNGWEHCTMVKETSSAWCATLTDVEDVFAPVERAWRSWLRAGRKAA